NGPVEQQVLETAVGQEEVAAEAPELQPPRTSLQNDVPAAEATNVVESKSGTVPADAEEQELRSQPGGTSAGKESQESGAAENSFIQPVSEQDRQIQAVEPSAVEDEAKTSRENMQATAVQAAGLLMMTTPSEGMHELQSGEEGPVAAEVIRANSVTAAPLADPEEQ
ncbi:unnamed protein product, partial [Symbiodinium necroappetens]